MLNSNIISNFCTKFACNWCAFFVCYNVCSSDVIFFCTTRPSDVKFTLDLWSVNSESAYTVAAWSFIARLAQEKVSESIVFDDTHFSITIEWL